MSGHSLFRQILKSIFVGSFLFLCIILHDSVNRSENLVKKNVINKLERVRCWLLICQDSRINSRIWMNKHSVADDKSKAPTTKVYEFQQYQRNIHFINQFASACIVVMCVAPSVVAKLYCRLVCVSSTNKKIPFIAIPFHMAFFCSFHHMYIHLNHNRNSTESDHIFVFFIRSHVQLFII